MNKQGKNRVLYYTAAVIGGLIYIALAVFMSVMVIKLVSKNGVYPSRLRYYVSYIQGRLCIQFHKGR